MLDMKGLPWTTNPDAERCQRETDAYIANYYNRLKSRDAALQKALEAIDNYTDAKDDANNTGTKTHDVVR